MKKRALIITMAIIIFGIISVGVHQLSKSRTFQVFGELIHQVETNEKVVALTFDDGPTDNVHDILALLEKYGAKATFFLIGEEIITHPDEAELIVNAGHQVGNHTLTHKRMIFKTPAFIKHEIEETNQLIRQIGYEDEIDYRPPNGKKLLLAPFYLYKHNIDTIMWNLEPDNYFTEPQEKMDYVMEHVSQGSIILLHPMYDQTGAQLEVIEGILARLSEEGYSFVTIGELKDLAR